MIQMFTTISERKDKTKRILRTSLKSPKLDKVIERRRLLQALQANSDKNLILLQAAPGYGKTFLAAQYYSHLQNTIWISIVEDYFCFNELLLHIIYAVDQLIKTEESNYLANISHFLTIEELIVELINLLKTNNHEDLYIFIDNYDQIKFQDREIEKMVNLLFSYLPTHVHMILISCTENTFSLARYRLKNTLFQLNHNDFILSIEEVDEFLTLHGLTLSMSELHSVYQSTHGWIGMLALLVPELKNNNPDSNTQKIYRSSKQVLQYLEYLVSSLPEPERDFLIQISIFTDFSLTLCNKYLSLTDSEELINRLKMKNFIHSYGNSYQIHNLLRTYLIGKIPHQNLLENYIRAARVFNEEADYESAAYFLVKADKIEEALEIILHHFHDWQIRSNLSVYHWLEQIPSSYFAINPNLFYYRGLIKMYSGKYDEAILDFKNSKYYQEYSNTVNSIYADINIAHIYQHRGNHKEVLTICEKSLANPYCNSHPLQARIFQLIGGSLIELASYTEGKEYLHKALQQAEASSDKGQEAWILCDYSFHICIPNGDYHLALEYYDRAYTLFQELNDMFGQAHTLFLKSLLYYDTHDLSECQRTLEATEYIHSRLEHSKILFYICIIKTRLAITNGNYIQAEKYLDKLQQQISLGSIEQIYLFSTYCTFYIARHDFARANFWCEKFMSLEQHIPNKYSHLEFYLHQINTKFQTHDYSEALKLIEIMRQICLKNDFRFYLAEITLYEIVIFKLTNKLSTEEVKNFLVHLEQSNFLFLLKKFSNLAIILKDDIRNYLTTANEYTAPLKSTLQTSVSTTDLDNLKPTIIPKIFMFGSFRITFGTEEFNHKSIKNKKALNLLKFLILNRASWIPQERIIDIFWPEFELEKGRQNLYVTLYKIRKKISTYTPDPKNFQFILSQNSSYKFNTEIIYWLDLDEFDNLYSEGCYHLKNHNGSSAKEHFLKAKTLYSIGLLPDNCYEEWAERCSEHYALLYINCLKNLFTLEKKPEDAIQIGQEILDLEPFAEEISIKMLKLLLETGQQKRALQLCQRLKRIYYSELDLRLPREIEEIFYIRS